MLLTGKNANPNGNVASALGHALTSFDAPDIYSQAQHLPDWFNWSNAVSNKLAMGARWVYFGKVDGTTDLPSTFKARWVAKDYSPLEEIDYNELYGAVAHKDTI